jgi:hypothetical protein
MRKRTLYRSLALGAVIRYLQDVGKTTPQCTETVGCSPTSTGFSRCSKSVV